MTAGYRVQWFDGTTAREHDATILVSGGTLRVVSAERMFDYPVDRVAVSRPVAGVPRRLTLPDGGTLVFRDGAPAPGLPPDRSFAHRLESHLGAVFAALLTLVAVACFGWRDGIPLAARYAAHRIPMQTEGAIGAATLATLDRVMLRPSLLAEERQQSLRASFAAFLHDGGVDLPMELQFRRAPYVGPNALALPGGTVIVTDELVKLLETDDLIDAVLAHEVGHQHERHALQAMLEQSALALVFGTLLGDVSGIGAVAGGAPALLTNLRYSREAEASADAFAWSMLRRAGSSPSKFADALQKLAEWQCAQSRSKASDSSDEDGDDEDSSCDDSDAAEHYLSTHPETSARIAAARAAAR